MKGKRSRWEEWSGQLALIALLQALLVPYNQIAQPRPSSSGRGSQENLDWLISPPPSLQRHRMQEMAQAVGASVETRVLTESYAYASPMAYETPASWGTPPSLANVAGPSELSLEDADVVDVLWRADAEMEKGRVPHNLHRLDLQHEQDMDLLTQKHLSRDFAVWGGPDENDPTGLNRRLVQATAQQAKAWPTSFFADELGAEVGKASSVELLEEKPLQPHTADFAAQGESETGKTLEWDDWLSTSEAEACEAASNFETFLSSLDASGAEELSGLLRDDVCLSSAAVQQTPEDGHDQRAQLGPLTLGPPEDLDSIPTPSLDLSPMEVGQLFADANVAADVAASVSALGESSTAASADSGPSSSRGGFGRLRRSGSPIRRLPSDGSTWVEAMEATVAFPDFATDSKEAIPTASSASPRQVTSPGLSGGAPTLWLDHDYSLDPTSPQSSTGISPAGDPEEGKLRPAAPPRLGRRIKDEEEEDEEEEEETGRSAARRAGRRSEDEALCVAHGITYQPHEIVSMPLQTFLALSKDPSVSPTQLEVMKKIRRRGKNKLAARNCRKRKTTTLEQLDTENSLLQQERRVEAALNRQLREEIAQEEAEIAALEAALSDE